MAEELNAAAAALVKALDATERVLRRYFDAAIAAGRASGNPTERGLDARQVRYRLQAEVLARLSPKQSFGQPEPVLQLNGAPEARRYAASRALPGLTP